MSTDASDIVSQIADMLDSAGILFRNTDADYNFTEADYEKMLDALQNHFLVRKDAPLEVVVEIDSGNAEVTVAPLGVNVHIRDYDLLTEGYCPDCGLTRQPTVSLETGVCSLCETDWSEER